MRNVEKFSRSDSQPANDNTLAVYPKNGHISITPVKKGRSPSPPFSLNDFMQGMGRSSGVAFVPIIPISDNPKIPSSKTTYECSAVKPFPVWFRIGPASELFFIALHRLSTWRIFS